ncbi:MAG TPA: PAS domain S-box protein [Longimicrobiales bacterium]
MSDRAWAWQVGIALATVAGAVVVRVVLDRLVGGDAVFLPFGAAVVISAWYGRIAGGTAALLSAATAAFVFLDGVSTGRTIFWFAAFLVIGLVTTALIGSLHLARRAARIEADRALEAQQRLDEETAARRRSEFAFVHLLRANLFGVGVATRDGRWIEANPALLDMLGLTWHDLEAGQARWHGLIPLDEASRRAAELGLTYEGASGPVEIDFVRADGLTGTALLHLMSPDGTDTMVVLAVDITARRETERALHESEAQFRLLVESVADHAMFMLDPDGRVLSWNAGAERLLGYREEDVLGRHSSIFHTSEDQNAGRPAAVLKAALRESRHEDDGWRVRKDGTRFWANVIVAPTYAGEQLLGFAQVMRDLSARHTADLMLKSIMDGVTDGIIGIDEHGVIRSFNVAAERMFDYSAAEVLGSSITILLPEPYRTNFVDYLARFAHAGLARVGRGRQLVGLRGDGTTFPLELAVSEFMLDGRRFFTGIVRDISRQRALEEQLQQAQKMQAVGQLAGGIAHDFNNLLTIIAGHTELLLAHTKADDPLHTALTEMRDAGMRAAGLTRQLLAFSRRAVLEPKVLDLNRVVKDTKKMLGRIIGEDIELVTRLAPALRHVSVDQGQIGQVLINLVVNARDAMPDGGRIEIETANCDLEPGPDLHPEARPGPSVVLRVRDQGVGMTPDVLQRIFEPFFTTKQPGAGTGLGLAMVYGIVRQSGGHVEVTSEPHAGSEFRVFLPATEESAAAAPRPRRLGDDSLAGSECLLVVEDDVSVRRLAVLALRAHGYRVIEASNGAEALRVLAGRENEIDLVVTDVVMPVMGGRQLVEALKPLRTDMRVLYVSGYTDDAVIRHGVQRADVAFLQKPYTPQSLAEKVRRVLDGGD